MDIEELNDSEVALIIEGLRKLESDQAADLAAHIEKLLEYNRKWEEQYK